MTESAVIHGDASSVLAHLPAGQFRCCVTSPPYWGLRDYNADGQIGAESNLSEYIANLVTVFEGVKRVLSDDGTLWLNIGDSYTSGNRGYRAPDKKSPIRAMAYRAPTPEGLKPKDLIGVPWRLAFALQDAGWYLRADIVWEKPNCMPESVKDRPTRSHEYLFLLTKSPNYYYSANSVREIGGRNRRSVWTIPTEAFNGAHFATFPTKLVEPCVLAGSEADDWLLDPFFGSGTLGVVATQLRRRFVGIEINREYVELAGRRLEGSQPMIFFATEAATR
ncbi:MAG: site-specific DNA-methyltransferase [Ardenticatenales bacterium]